MKKLTFLLCLTLVMASTHTQAQSETLDSNFGTVNETKLTDEQAAASGTFVHQGLKDKALKEGCAQKGLFNCDADGADRTNVLGGGLGGALEKNIGKLYGLVFGAAGFLTGGGGPKVSVKPKKTDAATTPAPAEGAAAAGTPAATGEAATKAKPEKKADYCMYGAMGYELIAGAMQTSGQKQSLQENANLDPQLQALAALKDSHKTRKKTATFQSALYGATAACYVARAATGGVIMDASYIVKMSASAGLAVLFKMKADKHGKAMQLVQKVIDSLPKAGDCNPYTGTSCFCKEVTSQTLYPSQFQEVCVLNNGNAEGTMADTACGVLGADNKMTIDSSCSCKATNTCFVSQIRAINPKFPLGANFMNQANDGYKLLSAGDIDEAALAKYSAQTSALVNRVKKNSIPNVPLTDDQKKLAASLDDYVPAGVAALAAASPSGDAPGGGLMGGSTDSALDKLPESLKKKVEDMEVSANYKGGGGFEAVGQGAEESFSLPGAAAESAGGTEMMNFAEKAVSKADVTNSPDTPIFDIISNRYQRSGWEKLKALDVK